MRAMCKDKACLADDLGDAVNTATILENKELANQASSLRGTKVHLEWIPPEEYEQQDRTVLCRSSYLDSDANTCSHSLAAIQISGRAAISRISSSA